jgi:hypothetical protein
MFRFTIRDVLWLTVVVALVVAWFVQRRELEAATRTSVLAQSDVRTLVTLLDESGDRVMWDEELGTIGAMATDPELPRATEPKYRDNYPVRLPHRRAIAD